MLIPLYYLTVVLLAAAIGATLRFWKSREFKWGPKSGELSKVQSEKQRHAKELADLQEQNALLRCAPKQEEEPRAVPSAEDEIERNVREQARLLGFTDETDIQREIAHRLQHRSGSMPMGRAA